jgi:secretion/DNA translocation related TadE-like protein
VSRSSRQEGRGSPGSWSTNDSGNASISVLGLVAVVAIFTLGLGDLSVYLLARAKAQTAADAAALAAAAELLPGSGRGPAVEARRFAEANGATLLQCLCPPRADAASVRVSVPARFAILRAVGADRVIGRARAEVDLGGLTKRRTPSEHSSLSRGDRSP